LKPLLYLFSRTFVNGVKRAFSSGPRVIGLLFFSSYYIWLVTRGMVPRFGTGQFDMLGEIKLPPLRLLEAIVFGIFLILTVFLSLGIFGYKGGFKAADVDVLFPTPMEPKTVLVFRLFRDYAITLIAPLFFMLIFFAQPASMGWSSLTTKLGSIETAGLALRCMSLSYFLLVIAWVSIGYAASLYFGRPGEFFEKAKIAAGWVMFVVVGGSIGWVAYELFHVQSVEGAVAVAFEVLPRSVFFLASFSTWLTMAPLAGNVGEALLGFGGLVVTSYVAMRVALAQSPWVYEQTAIRVAAAGNQMKYKRQGDMYAMTAVLAQRKGFKVKRLRSLESARWTGAKALVWKELLLLRRTSATLTTIMSVVSIGMAVFIAVYMRGPGIGSWSGMMLLFMEGMFLMTSSGGMAQAGFIENMRRIDTLKPLPFKCPTIVGFEIAAKALPSILTMAVSMLVAMAINFELWPYALAGLIILPVAALAISALSMLVVLLLPDFEDPTQRGFRGLVWMLGFMAFAGPPVAVFAALVGLLKAHPVVAALPAAGMMLAMGYLAVIGSSKLYLDFNPSE
jgi:hypothetical protein